MAEITIGTKLQSVRTGLIATVADISKKYRTAFVEFNNDTTASYSLSTLKDKRQFVVVTNDEAEEITQKQESEALEQVSEEIVQVVDTKDVSEEKSIDELIDPVVFAKFVKKAQALIRTAYKDETGYRVTINANGKYIYYHDKNLQNIRSAIGHIYRGEVTV